MSGDSPRRAVAVVVAVVVVCATLVSLAVVVLRPLQLDNRLLEQASNVLLLIDGSGSVAAADDATLLERFRSLDARVADLETGRFERGMDALALAAGNAIPRPPQGRVIPPAEDLAQLGQRPRHVVVYLDWSGTALQRIVLPVYGQGMWAMIRGFVALEGDLNTIAAAVFYEQAETPGVGDRITHPDWLRRWQGRRIYDEQGEPRFAIAHGRVEPGSASALHHVDGLSGATVTADAVTAMVRFWFGPWGYRDLLAQLRAHPPARPERTEDGE